MKKADDNKTALLKSVLKTVMDPPGGLNWLELLPNLDIFWCITRLGKPCLTFPEK